MTDAPERIWADEDTWFAGPGITNRAKEYVRADLHAAALDEMARLRAAAIDDFVADAAIIALRLKARRSNQGLDTDEEDAFLERCGVIRAALDTRPDAAANGGNG